MFYIIYRRAWREAIAEWRHIVLCHRRDMWHQRYHVDVYMTQVQPAELHMMIPELQPQIVRILLLFRQLSCWLTCIL